MSAAVYIEGVQRPQAAIVVVLVGSILLAAGCGGGGGAGEGAGTTASTSSATLESLWRAQGESVGAIAGTSDFQVGQNRVSFLVVDKEGRPAERPTAKVWVARGLDQKPFARTTARLEPIGVPGGETADAGAIYVARIDTASPGTYWYLAQPTGGRKIQALGTVVVKQQSAAPPLCEKIRSLSLLQTAFSHNGFSKQMSGFFRSVVENNRVHGPILVTHTANDTAVGIAYPLASRLSGDQAAALGDKNDKFGGLGRNGAQKMEAGETSDGVLLDTGGAYNFAAGRFFNLEASKFISGHSDVRGRQVAYAIRCAVR